MLPDGGKKLDDAIDLINSILDSKGSIASSEPPPVPIVKTLPSKNIFAQNSTRINVLTSSEEVEETEDEDLEDITDALGSVNIKVSGVDSDKEEDLFKFPDDPLSPHEIDHFLCICKLPSNRYSDQITCHPFLFHLGNIGPNRVCLRVIDCQ